MNNLLVKVGAGIAVLIALVIYLSGQPPAPEKGPWEEVPEYDMNLLFGFDMSESNDVPMAEQGKAYQFALAVISRYSNRNSRERMVIFQLSARDKESLCWEGSPKQFRKDFPSPKQFRELLVKSSNKNGSRIHDGITENLERLKRTPGVTDRTKVMLLVCSDFIDNDSIEPGSEQRLLDALTEFGKRKHSAVGFYFLPQPMDERWTNHLQSRVKHQMVIRTPDANPPLPTFE